MTELIDMRLTDEEIKNCYDYHSQGRKSGKTLLLRTCNELLEYKAIEKELGIDLITLLKTKNVIYVKDALGCIHKVDTKDYGLNINLVLKAIILSRNYYFIDYGKTWAFTKEELENE